MVEALGLTSRMSEGETFGSKKIIANYSFGFCVWYSFGFGGFGWQLA